LPRPEKRLALGAYFVAALVTGCGPLVQAHLEPVEACWEMQRVDIPAVPFVLDGTWSGEGRWALPAELRQSLNGMDPTLKLVRVELTVQGVDNLEFIREVRLRALLDPTAAPVEIAPQQTSNPTTLLFAPEQPLDVTPALDSGALKMMAEISARLPQHPWALVLDACYQAGGTYEWRP
jgi:hypothetical protein